MNHPFPKLKGQNASFAPPRRRLDGWLVLDKPYEMTSNQAVGRVKKWLHAKKVGHAGTLDPLATGILPLALGEATKTVAYMMDATKDYEFTIRWGQATATDDAEGDVIATSDTRPTADQITQALSRFVGEIEQTPPKFSAIKVAGARAYDLARKGEDVKLAARRVTIHAAQMIDSPDPDHARFWVTTGKGVYIRSLARDLAAALSTCGHVSALRRTRVGSFDQENAISLEKCEQLSHSADFLKHLLPVATGLDDIPALTITGPEAQRVKQGHAISLTRTHVNQIGGRKRVYAKCGTTPVAVGDVKAGQFHPIRVFNFPVKGFYDVD